MQETAFQSLKEKITISPVLKYYEHDVELTLQCDALETVSIPFHDRLRLLNRYRFPKEILLDVYHDFGPLL